MWMHVFPFAMLASTLITHAAGANCQTSSPCEQISIVFLLPQPPQCCALITDCINVTLVAEGLVHHPPGGCCQQLWLTSLQAAVNSILGHMTTDLSPLQAVLSSWMQLAPHLTPHSACCPQLTATHPSCRWASLSMTALTWPWWQGPMACM